MQMVLIIILSFCAFFLIFPSDVNPKSIGFQKNSRYQTLKQKKRKKKKKKKYL